MFKRRPKQDEEAGGPEPQAPGSRATEPPATETPGEFDSDAVVIIDDETFFALTEGGYTVVDFWAAWCAPCRSFAPVFGSVAAAHTGPVRFGSCDIEASPRTAELLQIRSIPTLVAFGPDGSEIGRSTGGVSRGSLEATVAQLARR